MGRPSGQREEAALLKHLALRLLVHGEALLRWPNKYLVACYWLLVGKRVRGRNRLSPLLGTARFAYAAWIAEREPLRWPQPAAVPGKTRLIVAIDARGDRTALGQSVESLDRGRLAPDRVIVLDRLGVNPAGSQDRFTAVANLADLADAISDAGPAFLIALNAGDCLAPRALDLYAQAVKSAPGTVCYADDDLIDRHGRRREPHFKPNWNAELYRYHDFISGAAAVPIGTEIISQLQRNTAQEDWIGTITRAAIAVTPGPPRHIPHVLVHRRGRPEPVVPTPTAITSIDPWPSVSVIILTRNQRRLLEACLEGLTATRYPLMECLIVDNGSDDASTLTLLEGLDPTRFTVLRRPGPFNFAALNNAAAAIARGEYLCLLNNDVSMTDPDWLDHLMRQACRPEVGAVGARLHYPDGTVQHAGVVLGVGGGAAHAHRGLRPGERGYFYRADLPQFVSAVTAACLVVARDKFLAVGGFDAETFAVAFNDVDLCLRLNSLGWQSFYEPRARLLHHESKSRGTDLTAEKQARFAGELARLKQRWHTDRKVDPFHHPALCQSSDSFVIGL